MLGVKGGDGIGRIKTGQLWNDYGIGCQPDLIAISAGGRSSKHSYGSGARERPLEKTGGS